MPVSIRTIGATALVSIALISLGGCQPTGPDPSDTSISVGVKIMKGDAGVDGQQWLESFAQAKELSAKTGRPILADFTGSDWCHFCTLLHDEVFSTPAFHEWASQEVVLLELDFPNSIPQSIELATQNQKLQKSYGISGYPTVLFLNSDGTPIGRSGYQEGGAEKWIAEASRVIQ